MARAVARDSGHAKAAALQALVVEHQAAAVPEQDLATVATPPEKHEQVPGEQADAPLAANDRAQPIVTTAQIHRLNR